MMKLIWFDFVFYSKIIDQSLYLALLLPVEEKYAKIVDHMDKTEGICLCNYPALTYNKNQQH